MTTNTRCCIAGGGPAAVPSGDVDQLQRLLGEAHRAGVGHLPGPRRREQLTPTARRVADDEAAGAHDKTAG